MSLKSLQIKIVFIIHFNPKTIPEWNRLHPHISSDGKLCFNGPPKYVTAGRPDPIQPTGITLWVIVRVQIRIQIAK